MCHARAASEGIPACMVSRRLAHALFSSVAANRPVTARVLLLAQDRRVLEAETSSADVAALLEGKPGGRQGRRGRPGLSREAQRLSLGRLGRLGSLLV